jgi:hypothetical protein
MMPPQSFHLLAFAFLYRRVIPYQIPCHDGWLGTASTPGKRLALSLLFSFDLRLHLVPKVPKPVLSYGCCLPGGLREKATESCQARMIGYVTQQSTERSRSLAEHQPQQYDHEVLVLRFTPLLTKPLGQLAQVLIQTYNGNKHGHLWSKGFFFTFQNCLLG